MLNLTRKILRFKRKWSKLADKYQLIKIKDNTLYIIDKGLSREEIENYSVIINEDDCDRVNPSLVYAVSDFNMSRMFGR